MSLPDDLRDIAAEWRHRHLEGQLGHPTPLFDAADYIEELEEERADVRMHGWALLNAMADAMQTGNLSSPAIGKALAKFIITLGASDDEASCPHDDADALTYAQLAELPEGTRIVITWSGGNGPHEYVIHQCDNGTLYAASVHGEESVKHLNPIVHVGTEHWATHVWLAS